MTTILRLDSSASGPASITNRLNSLLVDTVGDGAEVIHRDLTTLPSLSAELLAANNTPMTDRTAAQAELATLADALIDELERAAVVVLAAPIYNFGVPSGLKAWMDLVARAGRTFRYTETGPEGLIGDKKTYVVSASGGVPLLSEADLVTPHVRTFLGFLGISDITLIDSGGLAQDPTKVEQAEEQIRQLATI